MNVDTEIEKTEQCEIGSQLFLYCDDSTREKSGATYKRFRDILNGSEEASRAAERWQICKCAQV